MRSFRNALAASPKQFVDALNWLLAAPWVGAIIPFFSLGVGYAWSSWKGEIAASFLVPASPTSVNFSLHSTLFWLLCLLLLSLGVGNAWAKNRDSARASAEVKQLLASLQQRSQELTTAVGQLHSLPPLGVLEDFRKGYDLCDSISAKSAQLDTTAASARADLEVFLRRFLTVIGRVIQTFDGHHLAGKRVRYGLNIMLYLTREEFEARPALKAELARRLRYADVGLSLDNAAGVLDMLPAVSIADGIESPDRELEHFAMPVALAPAHADRASKERPTLPGAVNACVNLIHVAYASIADYRHALEDLKANDAVKADMLDYFDQPNIRSSVQSFVCVPLFASDTGLVGVLNIHLDVPNPRIKDRMELLVPLVAPMRQQLARLLLKYKLIYLT
ncbi:MAG: hypothetical protein JWP29_28 [Rhodoferax sp.]|nr:hypothetical protein [Rhodoferax sp.]